MSHTEPEVRGATYSLIAEPRHWRRIVPPLDLDKVFDWILQYYEFCLRTDPTGEWVNGRWSAGNELMAWFVEEWDERAGRDFFDRIKALLAELYVTGSPDLRVCIETAVVEHLFEREGIREFFQDWKDHPQLGPAYEAGLEWVLGGGKVLPDDMQAWQFTHESTFDEVFNEWMNAFESYLRTDPRPRWTDIRDTAGWDMPRWFVRLWDEGRDRKYFERIKSLLAELYPTGTGELKSCIEQAVLGPMFEREPIRESFGDWKDHSQLGPAYDAALQWARQQGGSPPTE